MEYAYLDEFFPSYTNSKPNSNPRALPPLLNNFLQTPEPTPEPEPPTYQETKKSELKSLIDNLQVGQKLRINNNSLQIDTRSVLSRTFSSDSRWSLLAFLENNMNIFNNDDFNKLNNILCETYKKDSKYVTKLKELSTGMVKQ